MRHIFGLFFLTIILATGCVHKTPLTTEHTIAIDPQLLGLWEKIPAEAKGDPDEDRMVILAWSDTEYLAAHPVGVKGEFYRAYLVEICGRTLIQAQYIGNSVGRQFPPDKMAFPILTYEFVEGILIISSLNPEVVDDNITDSAALREAFIKNKDRPGLFSPPRHFRRLQDQ